jgi:hypothetical protein
LRIFSSLMSFAILAVVAIQILKFIFDAETLRR